MNVIIYSVLCRNSLFVRKFSKIYTKTGDKGQSSLYTGERRPKADRVFIALGDIDELSSNIGSVYTELKLNSLKSEIDLLNQLQIIQCNLQDVGTSIATPVLSRRTERVVQKVSFDSEHTHQLETWIDDMMGPRGGVPPLANFILPCCATHRAGAALHVSRAVCRRAERSLCHIDLLEHLEPGVVCYVNRLSDYLFTAARFVGVLCGAEQTIYRRQHSIT